MTAGRKKTILLLIPTLAGGGAERFFSILLRHVDRNCFEPHLAVLQAQGEYLQELPADVVVHDLKCSRGRYALPGIVRLIWKVRPQAVLSTLPPTNVALTLSKPCLPRGTRLLLSEAIHNSGDLQGDHPSPRLWAWLYRHLYKRADKVICLSQSMVDDMAVNFNVPREKLVRIYYPVDVQRVRDLAEGGGNPYSGPGPHLVAAGRLVRQKGFDLLLAAMPAIRAQLPHARLTILGQGPLRATLIEQAHGLGLAEAVHFPGFQRNPWPYLKYADVFVLSSRYEGLPNVLLEALALGTPIVATDCPGGIREIQAFTPDIVMVPPEDPQRLAEALISVCKAAKLRGEPVRGAPRDLSNFSLPRIIGDYNDLLSS
jgi:glycosyltransferase involved in cell wall biosynthesis